MVLPGPTDRCHPLQASLTLRITLWAAPNTSAASAATGPPESTTVSTAARAAKGSSREPSEKNWHMPAENKGKHQNRGQIFFGVGGHNLF